MAESLQPINFLSEEELQSISGIGKSLARTIVDLRNRYGNLTAESLKTLLRVPLAADVMASLDFAPNRYLQRWTYAPQSPGLAQWLSHVKAEEGMDDDSLAFLSDASFSDSSRLISRLPAVPKTTPAAADPSLGDIAQTLASIQNLLAVHKGLNTGQEDVKPSVTHPVLARSHSDQGSQKDQRRREDSDDDMRSASGVPRPTKPVAKSYKTRAMLNSLARHDDDSDTDAEGTGWPRPPLPEAYKPTPQVPSTPAMHPAFRDFTALPGAYTAQQPLGYSRNALRDIPKSMVYDGKSSWKSFALKFKQYASSFSWTVAECKVCLLHCLSGKALDYCARILDGNPDIPYRSLLAKMEGRFGAELQASAQAKFAQACQEVKESMEDWADRIQALAVEAFRNLPEEYCNQQAVDRFCQGLLDVNAGHSAFMKKHSTIEAAMDYVRLFKHSRKAMVGKLDHDTSGVADFEDRSAHVCAIQKQTSPALDLTSLQEELQQVKSELKKLAEARSRPPQATGYRGSARRPPGRRACYVCDDPTHIMAKCPHKAKLLNLKRSSQGSAARPQAEDAPAKQ